MHRHLITTVTLTCLLSTSALAQKRTEATGVGVGIANSSSQSGAVAISGQGGGGGQGGSSSSSLTINNPANTTSTVNQNTNLSGTTTSNVNQNTNLSGTTTSNVNTSGTTTSNVNQNVSGSTNQNVNSNVSGSTTTRVISSGSTSVKTVPSVVAPSLAAAGLETCLGSASGTVSVLGMGLGGGSTYVDPGCEARLDARTLASWGLKAAAVARICQQPKVWNSMPDVCAQYWPRGMAVPYGVVVADGPAEMTMSTNTGGSIRVVDGRDGIEKDCLNYSYSKQKCYHWSGEKPRARVAAINPTYTPPPRIHVRAKPPKPALPTVITAPIPPKAPIVEPPAPDNKS